MTCRIHPILWMALFFFAGCATAPRNTTPHARLALSVPCNSDGVRIACVDYQPPYPLHVLVRNEGRVPVRLWQEDCSWGYDAMQLRISTADGREHLVKKMPRAWASNVPRFVTLKPDETMVWPIELSSHIWEDLSWVPKTNMVQVHVTVVYSVTPDDYSKQYGVWTGRLASQSYDVPCYPVPKSESK
jgi:hypothetical protein